MSVSAIYVLDLYGKILISRNYRGTQEPEVVGNFMLLMMEREEEKGLLPVIKGDTCTFAFVKKRNVYVVATITPNANVSLVFVFLHKIVQVMWDYFKAVEEESIRDNIVVMHELLDEVMDFGYPQTTDSNILMEYILQESKAMKIQRKVPPAVTNAVSWRSEGIRYKKNEVFLDVIESVDLMANGNGIVISSEISGSVTLKSNLSGMPELRLCLNDKLLHESNDAEDESFVDLDDVKFHQCVMLSRFENNRTISFIPPDGEFELMNYRMNVYVKPPIWVNCVTEFYPNRKVEYLVKATSHFKGCFTATGVEILIPVFSDVDSPVLKAANGSATYVPEENVLKWYFKSFPGSKEFFMKAEFGLPSVANEEPEQVLPIQVIFEIPFFSISGIKVHHLKVIDKSGYKPTMWIRYVTQNGNYQIRRKGVHHPCSNRV